MTDSSQNNSTNNSDSNNAAVDMIRQKVGNLYGHEPNNEPNAREEVKEVQEVKAHHGQLSEHQAYMQKISNSGLSLAQIQTAWHNYYVGLPDKQKHEVWQEFYAEHDKRQASAAKPAVAPKYSMTLPPSDSGGPSVHSVSHKPSGHHKAVASKTKTMSQVKEQLLGKANKNAQTKLKAKQHLQSLLFGVGMGLVVVIFLLFGFFNDRFIAPFITPSRNVSSTPIIIDGAGAVGAEPKIVIPKINVEIPVVYDEPSVEEKAVQNALERGVVHYATTPNPGEKGNAVIFGHSSNNILNKGKYKFAFVLLSKLEAGDTFYLNKDGVRYSYKIYEKKIVAPNELGVLGSNDRAATVTLITCDPPGTTRNRLIIVGEQISPDPVKNIASSVATDPTTTSAAVLPSNAPSLWQRIKDWF